MLFGVENALFGQEHAFGRKHALDRCFVNTIKRFNKIQYYTISTILYISRSFSEVFFSECFSHRVTEARRKFLQIWSANAFHKAPVLGNPRHAFEAGSRFHSVKSVLLHALLLLLLLLVLELVVVIEHLLVAEHGSAVRRNEVASGLCLF